MNPRGNPRSYTHTRASADRRWYLLITLRATHKSSGLTVLGTYLSGLPQQQGLHLSPHLPQAAKLTDTMSDLGHEISVIKFVVVSTRATCFCVLPLGSTKFSHSKGVCEVESNSFGRNFVVLYYTLRFDPHGWVVLGCFVMVGFVRWVYV